MKNSIFKTILSNPIYIPALSLLFVFGLHKGLQSYSKWSFKLEDATVTLNSPCNPCELKGTIRNSRMHEGWYELITDDETKIHFNENGGYASSIVTDKLIMVFSDSGESN